MLGLNSKPDRQLSHWFIRFISKVPVNCLLYICLFINKLANDICAFKVNMQLRKYTKLFFMQSLIYIIRLRGAMIKHPMSSGMD